MSVINVVFSDEQLSQLSHLQRTHPHPVIRRRALIMLLKQQATPHHKIAKITGVCENTVRAALKDYNDGGIARLTTVNFRKPSSKLKPFDAEIKGSSGIPVVCATYQQISLAC